MAEAMAFARGTDDPFEIAFARYFESWLFYILRDASRALAAAQQGLALSEQHGFSLPGAMSQGLLGWAQAQLGSPGEGVSSLRRSLAIHAENSSRLMISDSLTRLAEAQVLDGAIEDALSTLEDALQADPEELVYQPNILTRRGELRFKTGHPELAEADFREGIDRAQKMKAKALELRAATGLARMLQARGDCDAARDLLAPVYGWFTEGFDAADLKAAKALLDELGA